MTKQLSTHDWEILSAYLDGELTSQEQSRLEHSLQQRIDLQQALDELRRTRIILRSAARVRAPRNFSLTPAMVGELKPSRKPLFSFNALRLSSALASVLLVLTVIGEWFSFSGPLATLVAMVSEPSAVAESVMPEAAMLPDSTTNAAELRQSITEEPSPKALMAPEGTPAPTYGLEALSVAETETTIEEPAEGGEPFVGAYLAETPSPEEAPLLEAAPPMEEAPEAEAMIAPETPVAEVAELPAAPLPTAVAAADSSDTISQQPDTTDPGLDQRLPWRFAQGVLLALALITGSAALITRQLHRSRPR